MQNKKIDIQIPLYYDDQLLLNLLSVVGAGYLKSRELNKTNNTKKGKNVELASNTKGEAGIDTSGLPLIGNLLSNLGKVQASGEIEGKISTKNDTEEILTQLNKYSSTSFGQLVPYIPELKQLGILGDLTHESKNGDLVEFKLSFKKTTLNTLISLIIKTIEYYLYYERSRVITKVSVPQLEDGKEFKDYEASVQGQLYRLQAQHDIAQVDLNSAVSILKDMQKELEHDLVILVGELPLNEKIWKILIVPEKANVIGSPDRLYNHEVKILGKVISKNQMGSFNIFQNSILDVLSSDVYDLVQEKVNELIADINESQNLPILQNEVDNLNHMVVYKGRILKILPVAIYV